MNRYADVDILEPAISRDIHARLLLATHLRIAGGAELRVSWPEWRDGGDDFGLLFRIFGDDDAIGKWLESISPLVKAGLVRAHPIAAVPSDVSGSVAFVRDRRPDRFSPSAAARLARRAAVRGEEWTGGSAKPSGRWHVLNMPSSTTGQSLGFHVARRLDCVGDCGGGRAYGLGHPVPAF